MAKIRNSMVPNTWGEGKEKIITMDNGDEYIVRNTMVPNTWGSGHEQEIVKRGSSSEQKSFSLGLFVFGLIAMAYLIGMLWLMCKVAGTGSTLLFFGVPVLGITLPIIVLFIINAMLKL